MRKVICIISAISFFSCQKARNNEEDLKEIKTGMKYSTVQELMRNKFDRTYDGHMYKQKIPVLTHYYESPFGASGDFEIWYNKKDSTVLNIYRGN